ncbi:hypothetical protein RA307_10065 [Xanthobacteraceae bacterium Astr-EGSB]|uniref:hypothetical protein n=1 Tax=Astrobacterium formosum TaxID=3069710 RepID=UPI0027B116B1|nr:hypothetical protein [Xanthobacteraceae bacterium Astr-EGSB]
MRTDLAISLPMLASSSRSSRHALPLRAGRNDLLAGPFTPLYGIHFRLKGAAAIMSTADLFPSAASASGGRRFRITTLGQAPAISADGTAAVCEAVASWQV